MKKGENFEKEKKGRCKENEIKLAYWVVNDFSRHFSPKKSTDAATFFSSFFIKVILNQWYNKYTYVLRKKNCLKIWL